MLQTGGVLLPGQAKERLSHSPEERVFIVSVAATTNLSIACTENRTWRVPLLNLVFQPALMRPVIHFFHHLYCGKYDQGNDKAQAYQYQIERPGVATYKFLRYKLYEVGCA